MTLVFAASTLIAGNQLAIVRTGAQTLEVQLGNSDAVAGVQFSLHTSSDVVVGDVIHGNRTLESHWMVASYKPNDTTVNVIILSLEQKTFPAGQGTLVTCSISSLNSSVQSNASLSHVMVTNIQADSLEVAINNLKWSNSAPIAASNGLKSIQLGQNYPNPFNPSTRIAYHLSKPMQVRLSVYDITGREVNRLVDQYQSAGEYSVEWNTNTTLGQKLSSGIYFARLSTDNELATRKMIMSK